MLFKDLVGGGLVLVLQGPCLVPWHTKTAAVLLGESFEHRLGVMRDNGYLTRCGCIALDFYLSVAGEHREVVAENLYLIIWK